MAIVERCLETWRPHDLDSVCNRQRDGSCRALDTPLPIQAFKGSQQRSDRETKMQGLEDYLAANVGFDFGPSVDAILLYSRGSLDKGLDIGARSVVLGQHSWIVAGASRVCIAPLSNDQRFLAITGSAKLASEPRAGRSQPLILGCDCACATAARRAMGEPIGAPISCRRDENCGVRNPWGAALLRLRPVADAPACGSRALSAKTRRLP